MDQNTNPQQYQQQQQQYQPQQQQYQPQQQQYQPQQQQYQPQQQQYQQQQYQPQYQQTAKLKGSTLVKVVGILMTIFGPIGIIVSIYSFTTVRALFALSDGLFSMVPGFDEVGDALYGASGISPGLLYASIALSAVGSIILLIAGILGIKNHNNKEKAGTLIVLGVIIIAVNVISSVLSGIGGNFTATNIVGLLLGAVIPVLYIIGAMQNKKS